MGVKAVHGGLINSAVSAASAILSYVTKITLAWFLTPEDFKLFALAGTFVGVMSVFRDAGAGRVLVQRGREFDALASSVFWLTLAGSSVCGVVIALASPAIASMYGERALVPVLLWMAAQFPIASLGTVSLAKLTIDLRWVPLGITSFTSLLVVSSLSVALAYLDFGVYALILPLIVGDVLRASMLWWFAGLRIRPTFDLGVIRSVLGGSSYVIGSGLTLAARSQGDYFILGLMERNATATVGTGSYYFAFTTSAAPARLVLGSLAISLFPIFSRMGVEGERGADAYTRTLHSLVMLGIYVTVLQACLAWPMFRLVLHPQWEPAATLFSILSIAHFFTLLNILVAQLLHAKGVFRQIFFFDLAFAPLELGIFAIGAWLGGPVGVAIAAAVSALIGCTLWHLFAFRVIGVSWRRSVGPLWRPMIAAIPIVAVCIGCQLVLQPSTYNDILTILCGTVLGTVAYALVLRFLWYDVQRDFITVLRRTLHLKGTA